MSINYISEKEIEDIIHAVIDPKNIVDIDADHVKTIVIVQNMDETLRARSERQLAELLSPLVPRTYGIWVNFQK